MGTKAIRGLMALTTACLVLNTGVMAQTVSPVGPSVEEAEASAMPQESGFLAGPQVNVPAGPTRPVPGLTEIQTVTVPADTVINVQLSETLHSKKNKQGDTVLATVQEPVYVGPHLVIPVQSQITGKISDIRAKAEDNGPNPYIIVDFYQLQRPNEQVLIPFKGTLIAYKTGLNKKDYVWRLPQKHDKLRTGLTSVLEGASYGFMADPIIGPPIGAGAALLKTLLVSNIAKRGSVKVKAETSVPISVQDEFILPIIDEAITANPDID